MSSAESHPENEKIKPKRAPRKRQVHNEVERRRKGKINNWIHRLSELLPEENGNKKSKISILEQAVGYIKEIVTERDKLLSDKCSEVQAEEINSLKRSIKQLQEQNVAYAKLLKQANISLSSLPKKNQKYSNKFSEDLGNALLQKFSSTVTFSTQSQALVDKTLKITSDSTVSVKNAVTVATATCNASTDKLAAISLITSSPSFSSSSQVILCSASSTVCSSASVQSTAALVKPSVIGMRKENCVPSSSGGGVTSALPSLPVMSSTIGSSFSNVYSKGMQIIILPAGTSFVQPSFVPSNIPVISPCLDGMWPVIVPQNVPLQTLTVATDNATNTVIMQPEINMAESGTIIVPEQNSVPETHAQNSSLNDEVSRSTISIPETNKISTNSETPVLPSENVCAESLKKNCFLANSTEQEKTGNSKPAEENTTATVPDVEKNHPPISTPVSENEKSSLLESVSLHSATESTKSLSGENITPTPNISIKCNQNTSFHSFSFISSVTKKRTPLPLQVLSANEIISLASKRKLALKSPLVMSKQNSCNGSNPTVSSGNKIVTSSYNSVTAPLDASANLSTKQTTKQKNLSINCSSAVDHMTTLNSNPLTLQLVDIESGKSSSLDEEISTPVTQSNRIALKNVDASIVVSSSVSSFPVHCSNTSDNQMNTDSEKVAASGIFPVSISSSSSLPQISCQTAGSAAFNNVEKSDSIPKSESSISSHANINKKCLNHSKISLSNPENNLYEKLVPSSNTGSPNKDYSIGRETFTHSNNKVCNKTDASNITKSSTGVLCIKNSETSNSNEELSRTRLPVCVETVLVQNKKPSNSESVDGVTKTICAKEVEITVVPLQSSLGKTPKNSGNMFSNLSIHVSHDNEPTKNYKDNENTVGENGNKGKSRTMKRAKTSSSITHSTLSVNEATSFSNSALDALNSALIASERSIHNELLPKNVSICSTSDILAKAAESIFGHDAFNNIELSSDDQMQTQVDYSEQYDAAIAFTTSDIFSNSLIIPPTSRSHDFHRSKDQSSQNSVANSSSMYVSETVETEECSVGNFSSADPSFSATMPELRDNGKNFLEEPPSKQVKDNSCQTTSAAPSSLNKRCSDSADGNQCKKVKSVDESKAPIVPVTWQNHTINSLCSMKPSLNLTNVRVSPSEDVLSQNTIALLTRPETLPQHSRIGINFNSTTLDNCAKQIPSTDKSNPQLCNSLPNTNNLTSSTAIFHSVNNLFNSIYSDARSEVNSSYSTSCSNKNSSDSLLSQGGIQINGKSCANDDFTTLTKPSVSTAQIANSKVTSHSMFQIDPQHKSLASTAPHTISTQTISALRNQEPLSVSQPVSALVSSFPGSIVSQHLIPNTSTLLSNDFSGRNVQFFDPNFLSSSSTIHPVNKTHSVPSSGNTDSLSHSLCSLLKETSANANTSSVETISSSILIPSIPISTSSNSSSFPISTANKYSALSLISNNSFSGMTESLAPQISSSIGVSTATSCFEALHPQSSNCNRVPKAALSYSAERLIHSQDKARQKTNGPSFTGGKKVPNSIGGSQNLNKTNCFASVSNPDLGVQSVSSLSLPPVTSFPSFPATFPPPPSVTNVRISSNVHVEPIVEYQNNQHPHVQDSILSQNPNFNIPPSVQNNICGSQNSDPISKSHSNLCLNVEASGSLYNSCNFLQNGKTGLDIMRTSDNGSSFQSIFVNSSYAQQVPKQSYCHYRDQPPVGNGEITEKLPSTTFPILPPIRSLHPGKSIIPDQRAHMVQSSSQSTYGGSIYHEPTNCSHEAITGNKPSIMNLSQETTYATSRPKQSGNGQMASNTQQQRSVTTTNSKGKAKKSKHSTAQLLDGSSNKTLNFNANASSINFNLFTVPDLSCGKSNISHVPNSYSKHNTQPIISVSIDSNNQQTKLPDPMLGSVMHHTFNPALHQQNESVLNLNFQAPVYSEASLPMPPPSLPLSSPCTTNPKMARTFPNTSHHPIRNFNLSNILPDMGNPMNSSNSSSVKFQPSAAVPQSHQELHPNMSTAILSAPHQSCASSLYPPPHPAAAVPSPVSSVLNHCHSSITSCSQPPAQNSDTRLIPKPPNPTPPFRNIVHTLPFP